ncbi:MAG: stage sporulation protein [Clostridiales bacterium]|nr:stage sporulation protein [Clostridiales bacterium]
MHLSTSLDINKSIAKTIFPIGTSFDLMERDFFLCKIRAYFIGINGLCEASYLQYLFSDLQDPFFMKQTNPSDIKTYLDSKIGYIQASLSNDWDEITKQLLSGPSVLFLDGFSQAILLDTRKYPSRSIEEPDNERVTRGARDGFVETLLTNTALIRRRIRHPKLTFEMNSIGSDSKTDVAIGYIAEKEDTDLLQALREKITSLDVTSLTMGCKSLEELLVKRRWYNPLPSFFLTERPDVACSYLMEGHIVLIVDNSPTIVILPCTIFEFTQSPEDYYKSPAVGNYLRFVRFGCILLSLFLLPIFLLLGAYYPELTQKYNLISQSSSPAKLFFYVIVIELGLDLFKYSSSLAASGLSSSMGIIGGLVISDTAIELHWATIEVIFYGALTLLLTLSLQSIEFGEAIRIYRIFLVVCTGFFGLWGFIGGLVLIFFSIITTPTFAKKSYFWPLAPFNWAALKTLLFRYPTAKAQPSKVWKEK